MAVATRRKNPGTELLSLEQKVLKIVRQNPEGIKLVSIGNQLGVNWRSLIGVIQKLLKEGKVYRVNGVYFLSEDE